MFRECTIRLIQTPLGYGPDDQYRRPERHVIVVLKKAWPLTAPAVGGPAAVEWHVRYPDPNGDQEANELWVGNYDVTWNNLNSTQNYQIGNPSSSPRSRLWRYILNENLELRLSYFVRYTGEDHDRLEDAISLRGAKITEKGFLPPGGAQGTGSGWIERPGPMFNRGLVYWRVN